MASSPSPASPPRYVPTLTEVFRLPKREPVDPVDPEWVVQQLLQRLTPQLEAIVRQSVRDVLLELENKAPPVRRSPD